MKPKRIISLLLVICLVAGLMPTVAFAAGSDKAIMLGTEHLQGAQADNIYFGTYQQSSSDSGGYNIDPIKWRVLANNEAGNTNNLFLLADQNLDAKPYNSSYTSITWEKSTIRSWLNGYGTSENNSETDYTRDNFIGTAFSSGEQNAVAETYVYNATQSSGSGTPNPYYGTSGGNNTRDKIFLLSIEEALNTDYGFNSSFSVAGNDSGRVSLNTDYAKAQRAYDYNGAGIWWLRSPGYIGLNAAIVYYDGSLDSYGYDVDLAYVGVGPAFNLNLNSVLFTSAAVGGKSSGTVGANALQSVSEYTGNEWKLTLLDSNRNSFTASATSASATTQAENYSYWTVDVTYSGAKEGDNEYVSAMLVDSSGSVLYYGRVAQNSARGTASITIPTGLTPGSYTLKAFSEQYNGDKKTDYASQFVDIPLTVTDATPPTLTEGTATRTGDATATVTFESNEAGTYYYAVVESGEVAPTDLTTNGTSGTCVTDTNTISVTGLSGLGAKDIYIVAKDAAGNVSKPLKITIPAYIAPSYGISASPAALNFGSKTVDYTEAPAAQTVTLTNTGNQNVTVDLPTSTNYIITAGEGFTNDTATLAPNGTAAFTVQPNTGLDVGSHDDTLNISGSNGTNASVKLSFTVNAVYTLTVKLNGGSGSTTGGKCAESAVVNIDAGTRANYRFTGWTTSNGGSFADAFSASTTFTMPAVDTTITANWSYCGGGGGSSRPSTPSTPAGPATGESGGWEEIGGEIAEAQPGDTIVVDMNGTTEVPTEIFEEVAGKDVTVEFDLGGGISWTVNGQDVPTGTSFQSLNLGVDMGTSGISVNVINNITGEYGSMQITLAHDGEFGFALTLTAPLGSDNAGHWANLYYYHEDSETLTFQTSGRIGADGGVSLRFTHASQYAIVIDDYDHGAEELPFTDVAEDAWYYDAVSYVYAEGLMAGTSATTFSPDITTSRAMIAVILWRLEGGPAVEEYTDFFDVADGLWYTKAIRWASNAGVVGGYPNGSFGPNDPITREQFAVMLYRYADYKGWDVTELADLSDFTDTDKISGYAVTAIRWANAAGIVGGYNDSTLQPQGSARRSEAASMLMRFCRDTMNG